MAYGWIPDKYDPNDKPYRSRLRGKWDLTGINLAKDHPQWFHNVYDQAETRSCVANATSAAYRYLARRLNNETTGKPSLMDEPSRLFIYYNARLLPELEEKKVSATSGGVQRPPKVIDDGSYNRDAFKGLNLYGVCAEGKWPFKIVNGHVKNINKSPPDDAYKEAKGAHVVEYCRLDPDHPDEMEEQMNLEEKKAVGIVTLMQLKQCLTEGYPVVFGFKYYWEDPPWEDNDEGEKVLPALPVCMQHTGPPPGKWNEEEQEYESFGAHAILAIGYDESTKRVLCQNSWDSTWSVDGKFWIAYSWIIDWEATDDFWMVRLIQ